MKLCYECEILILKWCLRNDEIMLWMWDFDIEMMFEKWWDCVIDVRYDIEVMLERCFEEHWIVLSLWYREKNVERTWCYWKWEPVCVITCTLITSGVDALA
jgi:hypothetical protein